MNALKSTIVILFTLSARAAYAQVRLTETGGGTNYVGLQAPASISTDFTWKLPDADGAGNQCLATDGAGNLKWLTTGSGTGYSLDASDGSPANALYVDAAGNVGIGTTAPSAPLTVNGSIRTATATNGASIGATSSATASAGVYLQDFMVANDAACATTYRGGLYFSGKYTSFGADNGAVCPTITTYPTFTVNNGAWPSFGIEVYQNNRLRFLAHPAASSFTEDTWTEAISVLPGGNVGIGSLAPGQKLTVAGTIESTSGGVKFPDGTVQGTASHGITTLTSSGNFTVPAGVYRIKAYVTGGGGGGTGSTRGDGSAGTYTWGGCSGGAGGTAIAWLSVTPGQVIAASVGGGGGGGSTTGGSGGAGSATTFSTFTGNAGGGGIGGTWCDEGVGGTATGGDLNLVGGDGDGYGQTVGGPGGASYWGGGGGGGGLGTGKSGRAYGSGGGGGGAPTQVGGTGSAGVVVVEW
jgi:hypothetical protein